MKVKCTCGNIFNYEENNKVCPKCKKFHPLPEEKTKKEDKKIKPKKEVKKVEIKKEPIKEIKEIKETKETQKTEVESENEETKELFNRKENEVQKKRIIMIAILFVLIMIVPILNALLNDKTETIAGGTGTLLSSRFQQYYISEQDESILAIRESGYTKRGKFYVEYESNVYGFADLGYNISFYVVNETGDSVLLGYTNSDLQVLVDEYSQSYLTKATTNYTQNDPRPVSLRIIIENSITGSQKNYTYNF